MHSPLIATHLSLARILLLFLLGNTVYLDYDKHRFRIHSFADVFPVLSLQYQAEFVSNSFLNAHVHVHPTRVLTNLVYQPMFHTHQSN